MIIFKKLFIVIIFIYSHFLFSETLIKSDLNFLNNNDKEDFLEKCLEREIFKDTPRCLNFLGLKIFLHNLDNSEISKQSLKYIVNQSIFYLNEAAKKGFIDAYVNLAWIYSNDNLELQDLAKSAEYFDLYYNLKKKQSQLSKPQKENKDQIKIDRNQIILGIIIMYKLDLFEKYNINQSNYYLTDIEYKKGKKIFKEIADNSNLSELEIDSLKKNILKTRETELNELENNLIIFQKKYRRVAIKELKKLEKILQELN